jgi:hypothetical protein
MVEPNPWLQERRDPATVAKDIKRGRTDKVNGWWISEVLDRFGFLESDFGYQVDEVFMHFRGSHVRFAGAVYDLVICYDPEDTGHMFADLWMRDDLAGDTAHPRTLAVNDVLRSRQPWVVLPDTRHGNLERSQVLGAIYTWSAGLRDAAPDVIRGAWPDAIAGTHLW